MDRRALPSRKTLRDLLDYDPETGVLTWRVRPLEYCKSEKTRDAWNRRWAGKRAMVGKMEGKYPAGILLGKTYRADRIVWRWMTGKEPFRLVHLDDDPTNARWANLENHENKWGKNGETR